MVNTVVPSAGTATLLQASVWPLCTYPGVAPTNVALSASVSVIVTATSALPALLTTIVYVTSSPIRTTVGVTSLRVPVAPPVSTLPIALCTVNGHHSPPSACVVSPSASTAVTCHQ